MWLTVVHFYVMRMAGFQAFLLHLNNIFFEQPRCKNDVAISKCKVQDLADYNIQMWECLTDLEDNRNCLTIGFCELGMKTFAL